jgi:hypothetical protein
MDKERGRIELDALLRLLKDAVGEVLRLQDGVAFLAWMQSQAPERFPELFSGLDERVVRALVLELGRQIWNATPLPSNGFRLLPLPRPKDQDPCLCGSGRSYGDCCASAPAIPGLTPELIGALIAEIVQGGAVPEEK